MIDEKGKELKEGVALGFPDTIVNQYSERVITLHNTTKYKIWVNPINTDETIELIKYLLTILLFNFNYKATTINQLRVCIYT